MLRRSLPILAALLCLSPTGHPAWTDEPAATWPWRYPGGESTQQIDGLEVTLFVPRRITKQSASSLLVLLHGARARGARLATYFRYWPRKNFVVCAPQATGPVWTPGDLERVRRIVKTLQAELPIHADKVHVAGFSNGASNLHHVAFHDDVKARSGTWVGGGFTGRTVPPWARTRFGALFMAGENDGARRRVELSPALLRGKVRSIELHIEPDIGHTWPTSNLSYHLWWAGIQEGRFAPGDDENFEWEDDLAEALVELDGEDNEAKGILFYLFDSEADRTSETSRLLQAVTLQDPVVRRLGRQLLPVMVDKRGNTAALARLGVPAMATPAIVLFGRDGKQRAAFSGRIEVEALRAGLREVVTR
jgi:hypothetical protein